MDGMLQRIARMDREGLARDQIAERLGVSLQWLNAVMDADGFQAIKLPEEADRGRQ